MKTIKELEKEIEKRKKKVHKKVGTTECPDEDYKDDPESWESWWDGDIVTWNARLETLKEVLELIDKDFPHNCDTCHYCGKKWKELKQHITEGERT